MNTATVSKTGMEFAQSTRHQFTERGGSEIALRKDQLHSWNGNFVGMVIEAHEGTVWLTQANGGEDVILTRGDVFRVNRPGQVVAQSLAPFARIVARSA
jgi:hypothetical protein